MRLRLAIRVQARRHRDRALFGIVGIVGVGLIGGSIGRALKERRIAERVLGFGRRRESLQTALEIGAVDEVHVGLGGALADVDLLIVCAPVDRIVPLVLEAAEQLPKAAVVTDAGSTKERIVAGLEARLAWGPHFVGSHPIAGSEQRGPSAACADLFVGRTCVVTPTLSTHSGALALVRRFWESLGMRIVECEAGEHDRVLARTSHLPHFASAALASLLREEDVPLSGTGLRDTTRLAAGDPELWTAIALENAAAILANLAEMEDVMAGLRRSLAEGDAAAVRKFLEEAKAKRDALGS